MSRYVALLRGINVGGKAKVEMPRLKKVFERIGTQNVSTYINSGNVLFEDGRGETELVPLIEQAIAKEFGLSVPAVLRSQGGIEAVCSAVPAGWTNDIEQKTDVVFLWNQINDKDILNKIVYQPEIETVRYIDKSGALVWNIGRENVAKGSGVKLIKTDMYKYMTIRNINTVRKLNALMQNT